MTAQKKQGKKKSSKAASGVGIKIVAKNPSARRDYFIEDKLEAGLVLQGTEVKSLRHTAPNLKDSFVDIREKKGIFEAWLINCHIAQYAHGNHWNHEEKRARKLLLHRREINRLFGAINRKGMSVIPTMVYLKIGRFKMELGIGKGKKKHDKREDQKKKTSDREMKQALKKNR